MAAGQTYRRISRELRSLPREWVDDAARQLKQAVNPTLSSDTGGDFGLSGIGNPRMTVQTKVVGDAFVEGVVQAGPGRLRGPWRWIESGTNPRPQGRGWHPGTQGKRTWSRAITPQLPRLMDDAERRFRRAVRG
jgi:hypothetical protein